MTRLKPLQNRVLVRLDPTQEKINGLWIPPNAQKPVQSGTVIDTGPGVYNKRGIFIATIVQPGDRVLFYMGAGYEAHPPGQPEGEYRLMWELNDILATFTN